MSLDLAPAHPVSALLDEVPRPKGRGTPLRTSAVSRPAALDNRSGFRIRLLPETVSSGEDLNA
jgi:hypothetical protein